MNPLRVAAAAALFTTGPFAATAQARPPGTSPSSAAPRPGRAGTPPSATKAKPSSFGHVAGSAIQKYGVVPKNNRAMYLGHRGHIDTKIDFDDFVNDDHTVAVWWYPQYAYAHSGPIVSDIGSGFYAFGQADYRKGDGGYKDAGTPMFFVQIGNKKALYFLPQAKTGKWLHIAVVRRNNNVKLYVEGLPQTPIEILDAEKNLSKKVPEISLAGVSGTPTGKIRLGRTDTSSEKNWQAYGMIDDLAVFDKALTAAQVIALRSKKRLTGAEDGLVAGLSFESKISSAKPLPPKLRGTYTKSKVYSVAVSKDRQAKDSATFNNPLIIGRVSVPVRLPFKKGEVWRVTQGQAARGGSHNGSAAFCYDFVLHKPNAGSKNYPNGTRYAPIYNAAPGVIVRYHNKPPTDKGDGSYVRIQVAPNEQLQYLHLAKGTLTSKASGGTTASNGSKLVPVSANKALALGEQVGKLGPASAHLHFAGGNTVEHGTTIPIAFDNYWASNDGGATWVKIVRGHPKAGQLIKR